jgi:hypothetical protein
MFVASISVRNGVEKTKIKSRNILCHRKRSGFKPFVCDDDCEKHAQKREREKIAQPSNFRFASGFVKPAMSQPTSIRPKAICSELKLPGNEIDLQIVREFFHYSVTFGRLLSNRKRVNCSLFSKLIFRFGNDKSEI